MLLLSSRSRFWETVTKLIIIFLHQARSQEDISITSSPSLTPREGRSASRQSTISQSSRAGRSPTRRAKRSKADEILSKVDEQLDRTPAVEDQFDVIGKNVAHKLRSLAAETAVVSEKLIMDVLFESQLGNVDKFSRIQIYNTRSSGDALLQRNSTNVARYPQDNMPAHPQAVSCSAAGPPPVQRSVGIHHTSTLQLFSDIGGHYMYAPAATPTYLPQADRQPENTDTQSTQYSTVRTYHSTFSFHYVSLPKLTSVVK